MAREHGFSLREVDSVVRPVVAKTPFRELRATRTGSMLRLELSGENRQESMTRMSGKDLTL
jgi:hypothetical protein